MDSEVKASTKKSDDTSEPHNDKHSAVNPGKLKKKEAADETQSFNVESIVNSLRTKLHILLYDTVGGRN